MSEDTWLLRYPNHEKSQYRRARRASHFKHISKKPRALVTGGIVLHTAENRIDESGADSSAEGVARFISNRKTYGSYHSIVDTDSIVHVGKYAWEMFHEGTGGNRWSLGLSFACKTTDWRTRDDTWVQKMIRNGAIEAAAMASWVLNMEGIEVPAKLITAEEYRAGKPGFTTHGRLDPGRRTDPGEYFPADRFLRAFVEEFKQGPAEPETRPAPGTRTPEGMELQRKALNDIARIKSYLLGAGVAITELEDKIRR